MQHVNTLPLADQRRCGRSLPLWIQAAPTRLDQGIEVPGRLATESKARRAPSLEAWQLSSTPALGVWQRGCTRVAVGLPVTTVGTAGERAGGRLAWWERWAGGRRPLWASAPQRQQRRVMQRGRRSEHAAAAGMSEHIVCCGPV